jgi:hypothetical protein
MNIPARIGLVFGILLLVMNILFLVLGVGSGPPQVFGAAAAVFLIIISLAIRND